MLLSLLIYKFSFTQPDKILVRSFLCCRCHHSSKSEICLASLGPDHRSFLAFSYQKWVRLITSVFFIFILATFKSTYIFIQSFFLCLLKVLLSCLRSVYFLSFFCFLFFVVFFIMKSKTSKHSKWRYCATVNNSCCYPEPELILKWRK